MDSAVVPLSSAAILEAAREHRVTLRRRTWYRARDRAGCAAAVAAIGVEPRLARRDFGVGRVQEALAGVPRLELVGLLDGFEDSPRSRFFGRDPDYRRGYRAGLEVARAAGLAGARVA